MKHSQRKAREWLKREPIRRLLAIRSAAAVKGWTTRRAAVKARSAAAVKGWTTRRAAVPPEVKRIAVYRDKRGRLTKKRKGAKKYFFYISRVTGKYASKADIQALKNKAKALKAIENERTKEGKEVIKASYKTLFDFLAKKAYMKKMEWRLVPTEDEDEEENEE